MSGSAKLALYLFGFVLGLFLLLHLIEAIFAKVFALVAFLVPILAVGGVVILVFAVANRRGIGPGRRRILP